MKKAGKSFLVIFGLLLNNLIFVSLSFGNETKLRIGWQVPWATQGQIVQILKHTDILKKNGLSATFIGRTYGPDLNVAALGGSIDVVLTADQPAVALFSKDKGWMGIGRLMYNRTLTYVPAKSNLNSVSELKGKTIGIPMGAAAERITVEALIRNGLNPKKDVKIINLGIRNQGALVAFSQGKSKWGNFDALSGFDPTPAIFESKGLIKVVDVGKVCSLVLMNKNFIESNPGVAKKMMRAIVDAYDYYRNNIEEANRWFMEESRLKGVDQTACNIAASIEPNLKVKDKGNIRVSFTEDDFSIIERAAIFMQGRINKKVDIRKYVTNDFTSDIQ